MAENHTNRTTTVSSVAVHSKVLGWCFLVLLVVFPDPANGFSTSRPTSSQQQQQQQSPETIEHPFIEFVDLTTISKNQNRLPVSWVQKWSTWVLEPTTTTTTTTTSTTNDSGRRDVFVKIPDIDGFLQPSSVDTLFQPLDLRPPTISLALGFHIRDGTIRHIMPAVDISYTDGRHRNRGLCSVPRAYQWIEYSHGVAFWVQNLVLKGWKHKMKKKSSNNADNDGGEMSDDRDDDDKEEWIQVGSISSGSTLVKAIERVQYALADDPPAELGDGSHIIHVLLDDRSHEDDGTTTTSTTSKEECSATSSSSSSYRFESPRVGYELCVVLQEEDTKEEEQIMTVGGNSLPYEKVNVHGILHVGISATMAGSESEYLPNAYRPLYEDLSLRNPLYEKYRQRRRMQQQQEEEE